MAPPVTKNALRLAADVIAREAAELAVLDELDVRELQRCANTILQEASRLLSMVQPACAAPDRRGAPGPCSESIAFPGQCVWCARNMRD